MWRASLACVLATVTVVGCSSSGPAGETLSAPPPLSSNRAPTPTPVQTIDYSQPPSVGKFTAGQRFQFLSQVRAMHDFKIELASDHHKVHVGRQICVGLGNGVAPTHMVRQFVHQGVEEDDASRLVELAVTVLCPAEKKYIGR